MHFSDSEEHSTIPYPFESGSVFAFSIVSHMNGENDMPYFTIQNKRDQAPYNNVRTTYPRTKRQHAINSTFTHSTTQCTTHKTSQRTQAKKERRETEILKKGQDKKGALYICCMIYIRV